MAYTGKLILIVGPSGVGKSVIINLLRKKYPEWVFPVTATTRAPRPTERDGVDYFFMTRAEFESGLERGDFLEHAFVHNENYYGVLKSQVLPGLEAGKVVLREVDIQGVHNLKKDFDGGHLVSIFLLPPSREVLIERIRARAPISDEDLEDRLRSLEKEVAQAGVCDYRLQLGDRATIEENFQAVERLILEIIR